jgi:hypothetical protein
MIYRQEKLDQCPFKTQVIAAIGPIFLTFLFEIKFIALQEFGVPVTTTWRAIRLQM